MQAMDLVPIAVCSVRTDAKSNYFAVELKGCRLCWPSVIVWEG